MARKFCLVKLFLRRHSLCFSAADSTNTALRYTPYLARARTILLSAHRYVAYTSDIGESFRPVAHPWLIKGAYGISWAYLIGDVSHEGYKAYLRNQRILHPGVPGVTSVRASDATGNHPITEPSGFKPGHVPAIEDYRSVMAQRAIFQSVASMGLPAFTIHSIVRYSGRALKDVKNTKIRSYGPIGVCVTTPPPPKILSMADSILPHLARSRMRPVAAIHVR